MKAYKPVDYAMAYAEAGYKVLPVWVFLPVGETKWVKAPLSKKDSLVIYCDDHSETKPKVAELKACKKCRGGVAAATSDPATIQALWRGARRSRCLVGVVPPEGVIVLDDDGHVFDHWLDGPHVQSPSGKAHFYFRLKPGQTELKSENGIVYRDDPEGLVDIRVSGDTRYYVIAPSGNKRYQKMNGMTLDPERLPELPDDVYDHLVAAPRKQGSGGSTGLAGRFLSGVAGTWIGNEYDRTPGVVEEFLDRLGWEDRGDRWIRPGGGDGAAKVSESEDGVWFANVHTFNDDILEGGHYYTATMLRCILDYDGDVHKCHMSLINEGIISLANGE